MARQQNLMKFHLSFGKVEAKRCTASSTNSLSVARSRENYQETFAMQSLLIYIRIKGKCSTVLTSGDHSALHCKKNLCSSAPEQVSTYHCRRPPPKNPVWLQSKPGNHRLGFILRQLQEKCREQNKGLYVTFVDLTKTFDTMIRKGLWLITVRFGCLQSSSNCMKTSTAKLG